MEPVTWRWSIPAPVRPNETRINERIRVPQVRVIGEDGAQLGILAVREALTLAQEKGLDLVEVSPTARPPVCRIMDYGKFKYEQSKRERKARKKQHVMHLKEVKLRPKIDDHDYGFKLQHAREFLTARDKVKFTVTFRGREMAHQELGHAMLQRVIADLADIAGPESIPRSEGRTLVMIMLPKPARTGPPPRPTAAPEPAAAKTAAGPTATAATVAKSVSAAKAAPARARVAAPTKES
ncbi:MAG: translation initiation factor IF-3 [Candidatus Eiseniibacteriota bacterium]